MSGRRLFTAIAVAAGAWMALAALAASAAPAGAAPPMVDPHPEIPTPVIETASRAPGTVLYHGYVSQAETSRKWPRVRRVGIQAKVGGAWRRIGGQRLRKGKVRVEVRLPARPRRIEARFVLRSGKRTVLRGPAELVRNPGRRIRARSVSVGYGQTCAVLVSRRVSCWGLNEYGELGDGSRRNRRLPVPVKGLGPAVAVSAASGYSCAIRADRRVMCWGGNHEGTLGTGNWRHSTRPRLVKRLTRVRQISTGNVSACAVRLGGRVLCWGSNGGFGKHEGYRLKPTPVRGVEDAIAVVADTYSSCAIRRSHRVACWSNRTFEPRPKRRLGRVRALQTSLESGCAIRMSHRLVCWGDNYVGQLGDGTGRDRRRPRPVPRTGRVRSFATNGETVCAVRFSGRVLCWGDNGSGELGIGSLAARSRVPRMVPGLRGARLVNGSFPGGPCVVGGGRSVRCWGDNSTGSLGDGTLVDRLAPVPVLAARR